MDNEKEYGFNSKAVHAGAIDCFGSAVTPIFQTSTFRFKDAEHGARCFSGEEKGYIYTRIGNPSITELEDAVAALEGGFGSVAVSSGMAAVNTVYLTFLSQGKHLVAHNSLYGPSRGVMETIYPRFGVESTFVDATDVDNVKNAIRPNTALIYLETPANPTMGIMDIEKICKIAHEHNIPVCVDNTFCSPYLQQPLAYGADVVLHSMTKFINGHADIVGGIVIAKEKETYTKLRNIMVNMGFNMDPHQAWLTRRGLKTLALRIEKAQENARKVAEYLENHPKVDWVLYPGLKSHPQYELAQRQMRGPGSMITFSLKGGIEAGRRMMNNVHLALLAVSLGGIETLIQHPASMTHSKLSKEARESAGITDGLIRLSVGIEEVEDIIADLAHALEMA
ncbi:MAG TPA: aminotransferase class I/II-fold pyridoxal phosphate-dependent enzyme [Bacteroidetes bacterium]|nr:aminotransferase class I/II-fold pyridoxal phosphate-dependent enzyme [Candidatus Limimorpha avicola]